MVYGNGTGDTFTFDVYRTAVGTGSFRAEPSEPWCESVVRNLPTGPPTLEISSAGDGDVSLDVVYVFQPPLQD